MNTKQNIFSVGITALTMLVFYGCTQNPESLLRQYITAHNRHDINTVLSFFDSTSRFEMVGEWIRTGKVEILELENFDAATNGKLIVSDYNISGNKICCTLKERNDFYQLLGVDTVYYQSTCFVFRGTIIEEIRAEMTEKTIIQISEAYQTFFEWAAANIPDKLAELLPGGEFQYGAENAKHWLVILKNWREKIEITATTNN